MKVLLLLSMFCLFLFSSAFLDISYSEAIKLANKDKKLIMLMVEEEYCPWCIKMKKTTFLDEDILELLKSDYISIKINKYNNNAPTKFHTRFVPTIYLINPVKQSELHKVVGYMSASSFYDILFVTSRFSEYDFFGK